MFWFTWLPTLAASAVDFKHLRVALPCAFAGAARSLPPDAERQGKGFCNDSRNVAQP
jgi:hypothetical protein